MSTELANIEPLQLLDLKRPERMPSLPAWVASRNAALVENLQLDASGSFRDVLTLPQGAELTKAEVTAIINHLSSLRSLLTRTPEASQDAEAETLVLVTKMLLVLPSQRTSEAGAEAKGEAYMDALDDVPSWAVRASLRNWHRSNCGTDERGKPYDYGWAPVPSTLRRISQHATAPVHSRIAELERLLSAVPFRDCSAELASGQGAWLGLLVAIKDKHDLSSLTFDQAIALADAHKQAAE